MKCDECGARGEGNYCPRCGAPLEAEPEGCPACGAPVADDAYYCTECGEPVAERPEKSLRDYLPWVLSGLALVAFAVAIAVFVQRQASPRGAGEPPTGGVITGEGGDQAGGSAPGEAGMPSASELAQMPPREAADRLYNRAMQMQENGAERAPFFARMGVRAYRQLPPDQVDADVRFHMGLLQLVQGNVEAARAEADTILADRPGHLLGLLLAARASGAAGEAAAERRWRDSLRSAVDRTDLASRPEYRAHRNLLETAEVPEGDS